MLINKQCEICRQITGYSTSNVSILQGVTELPLSVRVRAAKKVHTLVQETGLPLEKTFHKCRERFLELERGYLVEAPVLIWLYFEWLNVQMRVRR